MIRPDFNKFNKALSNTLKSSDSDICWREFLVSVFYFVNDCSYKVNEEEISDITKSLQNWTVSRKKTDFYEKDATTGKLGISDIKPGDIFLADIGLSYEYSYVHPLLVLDKPGNKLLIIPSTSTTDKLSKAFHPSKNPTGDKRYRLVLPENGFEVDSALLLDNMMVISKGRLLERKGTLKEDSSNPKPGSLITEIKSNLLDAYFGGFYREYMKLVEINKILEKRLYDIEQQSNAV
ncbi:MAG: hypothetical protein HPY50_09270 [Firmicutes bacterium]|nr:hypothetical protein [Bacillota bacterium]